ncbi:MAG: hypothetical protein OCD02_11280 [Spirochaetaceae bacterium]
MKKISVFFMLAILLISCKNSTDDEMNGFRELADNEQLITATAVISKSDVPQNLDILIIATGTTFSSVDSGYTLMTYEDILEFPGTELQLYYSSVFTYRDYSRVLEAESGNLIASLGLVRVIDELPTPIFGSDPGVKYSVQINGITFSCIDDVIWTDEGL